MYVLLVFIKMEALVIQVDVALFFWVGVPLVSQKSPACRLME